MKIKSSPELIEFYQTWKDWADAGGDIDVAPHFNPRLGLCANLNGWAAYRYGSSMAAELCAEMTTQFVRVGLDEYYPFGRSSYKHFQQHNAIPADPNRIRWVSSRLRDGAVSA